MCEIIGKSKIKDFVVIDCTPYDGAYINATIMRLFDDNDSVFETTDFGFEKFTQCFTSDTAPSIVTKANIPERFLARGNKVELV